MLTEHASYGVLIKQLLLERVGYFHLEGMPDIF